MVSLSVFTVLTPHFSFVWYLFEVFKCKLIERGKV